MDDRDLQKLDGSVAELGKSIFPTFNVDVPMPRDTAVPGSYHAPSPPGENPPPGKDREGAS